jgi:copper chaperone NosL
MRFLLALFLLLFSFSSCKRCFEPIVFGKEACAHCKMIIMDQRFSCEFINSKGRIYKFDDAACMVKFIKENGIDEKTTNVYVADFNAPATVINGKEAKFVLSGTFLSPMNGNMAAFGGDQTLDMPEDGKLVSWADLVK